jgi:HKD family nuclease
MIEFAFNAATSILTKLSAFMTNYEFESRMSFDSSIKHDQESAKDKIQDKKTFNISEKMKSI